MGRFITIAMCGVILVGIAGCAKRSPSEQAERQERRETAEASKYPPPPAKSKMAQITPEMREPQVMKIMGPPDDSHAYVTGKAFIPFYYGGDTTRFAAYYKGQGRIIFQGGNAWGGGRGKVVRVEYDPSEDGDATTK
jgi:hypothetical protein